MIDRKLIHDGMVVRGPDGKGLGRVVSCEGGSFTVEKGFFFATDYVARYDDVSSVSGDEVRLSRSPEPHSRHQHVSEREGGLGESFTLGTASGLAGSPGEPWSRAEQEEEETRSARRDEEEVGPRYDLGPPSHGDEGGGGLL